MDQPKYSGVLCHLSSLPTAYGIGDFGPVSFEFIDKLAAANQSYWQILPIGNTDDTGCPYATDSAFGCADYYISPDLLSKDYALSAAALKPYCHHSEKVDFKTMKHNKEEILKLAYLQFSPTATFAEFLIQEKDWINDYSTYRTLCETRGAHWREWGSADLSLQEQELIKFHQFCQFICFSQLAALKSYANQKGIKLVGDLPIFVSYNSMDVWKNPKQFFLTNQLEMEYETGAAPDGFSETGQKWGTPIYNWSVQKEDHYQWWNKRLSFLKRYFDVIRIDHFRGFCATWISKVASPDASEGHWYNGPGADLFSSLLHYPEIIAEDLGCITPDVDQLRDQFNFPGMKVFQFMLGDSSNPHKLYHYHYNSVAYSGTHDCDTLMGWLQSLSPQERAKVEAECQLHNPDHWSLLNVLMATPAQLVLIQVQDLLGLGSSARFNYPGTVQDSNWTWKMTDAELEALDWIKLSALTKANARGPKRSVCG